jgi:hypothetical protein
MWNMSGALGGQDSWLVGTGCRNHKSEWDNGLKNLHLDNDTFLLLISKN